MVNKLSASVIARGIRTRISCRGRGSKAALIRAAPLRSNSVLSEREANTHDAYVAARERKGEGHLAAARAPCKRGCATCGAAAELEGRMNNADLPQRVLVKLLALEEAVAALKTGADGIERGVEDRRA